MATASITAPNDMAKAVSTTVRDRDLLQGCIRNSH
jgi:hypothetical protein